MRYVIAMVGAAVLWSTSGLFIKITTINALSFTAWRSAIAAVTLFLLARALGIRIGVPRTPLAWFSVCAYALILLLFVLGTSRTTAANAIFLQYTAPVYVLLLEPLALKTRFKARDVGFVALALVGMGTFFIGRDDAAAGAMTGNALALASGVFFAGFAVALRARHGDQSARWEAVSWGNLVLFLALAIYFLIVPGSAELPPTAGEAWGIVFCGVVQIGLAYALFAIAISRLSALESLLLGMLEPLLNPVWVFLVVGERPTAWALAGAALIIASIVARGWLETREGRRKLEESSVGGDAAIPPG